METKSWVYVFLNIAFITFLLPEVVQLRRRHRHQKRTTNSSFSAPALTHKRYKCGIKLTAGCSCSKSRGSLAVTCRDADMDNVPSFELGIEIVRTLNLENNRISDIKLGDFYGMKIERLLLGNNTLSQLNVLAFWGLEYYLETLNISSNNFYSIPYAALRLLRHLRSLNLAANNIKSLRNYGFSSLDKLEVLSLDRNPISLIHDNAFSGTNLYLLILDELSLPKGLESIPTKDLKTLKGLSLARNNIDVIPNQWFSNITSLKYLKMDDNELSDLPVNVFRDVCFSLRTLELNSNKFGKVPKDAIRLLINLETLRLSGNFIRKLHARSFNCSRNLKILDLSNNDIFEISNAAFHGLDSIQKIDLRDNRLITLNERIFYWKSFNNREISLSRNPWLCNCLLQWIKKSYRKGKEILNMFPDLNRMRCSRPDIVANRPIIRLPLKDFTCDHDYYYYHYEDDVEYPDKEQPDGQDTTYNADNGS